MTRAKNSSKQITSSSFSMFSITKATSYRGKSHLWILAQTRISRVRPQITSTKVRPRWTIPFASIQVYSKSKSTTIRTSFSLIKMNWKNQCRRKTKGTIWIQEIATIKKINLTSLLVLKTTSSKIKFNNQQINQGIKIDRIWINSLQVQWKIQYSRRMISNKYSISIRKTCLRFIRSHCTKL